MSWLSILRSGQARLWMLALTAALIIVLPWLLMRGLWDRAQDATARVEHTQSVGTLLYRLQADIRDFESAALTLSKGVSNPDLLQRMALADTFPATLELLAEQLHDKPAQLVRIGQIKARLQRRVELARALAQGEGEQDQTALAEELVYGASIRGLVSDLQADESRFLAERIGEARRRDAQQELVSWVALALQIALMVVVLWRLYRQMQQLSAEQAVAAAASHTTAVFNSVREPIAVLDRELVLTLCNPAFVQLYARSEAGG